MKSIIWDLYHGNICGREIKLPEKDRMSNLAIYKKLKATLSKESDALFEEFLESSVETEDKARLIIYKRGIATGMLLAIEIIGEGEELCD